MGEKEMGHKRPRHQGGQNKEQYGEEEAGTSRRKTLVQILEEVKGIRKDKKEDLKEINVI